MSKITKHAYIVERVRENGRERERVSERERVINYLKYESFVSD